MKTCNQMHPVNVVCEDRRCYLGDRNPLVRMARRMEQAQAEARRLRESFTKRFSRAGEAA